MNPEPATTTSTSDNNSSKSHTPSKPQVDNSIEAEMKLMLKSEL
jgi:hypothetical protein